MPMVPKGPSTARRMASRQGSRTNTALTRMIENGPIPAIHGVARWRHQKQLDPKRLVFIDETWAKTNTFLASYGQVFRALPYLPGSPEDNVRQIYELHRRHGQQVIQIVDRELKNNASLVHQRVSCTRNALEQQFLNNCDIQLDSEDVVQNEEWKGYRLNPYLLLVKPTQLQGVGSMSQLNSSAVTTPPQPR
jgi:hypothetical protein